MRFIFLLIVALSAVSCSLLSNKHKYIPSEKQKLANKIQYKVAAQLKEETHLSPCGTGGQMMNEIKMLALSFDYYQPLNIEQARELLIIATERFISEINQTQPIHPYLHNYPFKPENVEIRIFLYKPDHSDVGAENLSVVSMLEGVLYYKVDNPKTKLFTTVLTETYEEALERSREKAS